MKKKPTASQIARAQREWRIRRNAAFDALVRTPADKLTFGLLLALHAPPPPDGLFVHEGSVELAATMYAGWAQEWAYAICERIAEEQVGAMP